MTTTAHDHRDPLTITGQNHRDDHATIIAITVIMVIRPQEAEIPLFGDGSGSNCNAAVASRVGRCEGRRATIRGRLGVAVGAFTAATPRDLLRSCTH
jgi:hypothetical protein